VAIQKLPVIFAMDRAGMVGADGQTHIGLYDIAYMLTVPNMTVAAPATASELPGLLRCALEHDGPFSIRYPRDAAPGEPRRVADVPAVPYGTWEILHEGKDTAVLAVGAMCQVALDAAHTLADEGIGVQVVNCRFIKPLDEAILRSVLEEHRVIFTIEDGTAVNGFGAYVAGTVESWAPAVRVEILGASDRTYEHAKRDAQLAEAGLTAAALADRVRETVGKEA
jgi:1-deoxy-D-xylulose-5-phosphate synthase